MPLDIAARRAVQQLLKKIKDVTQLKWAELGKDLGEDGTHLSELSYGRGRPSEAQAVAIKLLPYWDRKSNEWKARSNIPDKIVRAIEIGDAKAKELEFLREKPLEQSQVETPPAEVVSPAKEQPQTEDQTETHSFISALGINMTISEKSVKDFNGEYLHFALNDKEEVVTSKCYLSADLGADDAPIFLSSRQTDVGILKSAGAYFCSDRNLYLIASPLDSVDLRMSVFNVIPGAPQMIIRGMVLGVSRTKTILSSRCVLISSEHIDDGSQRQLYEAPTARPSFEKKMVDELDEISTFLFGEQTVDYIKLIKLTPQS
jgi:hypothetical protein